MYEDPVRGKGKNMSPSPGFWRIYLLALVLLTLTVTLLTLPAFSIQPDLSLPTHARQVFYKI